MAYCILEYVNAGTSGKNWPLFRVYFNLRPCSSLFSPLQVDFFYGRLGNRKDRVSAIYDSVCTKLFTYRFVTMKYSTIMVICGQEDEDKLYNFFIIFIMEIEFVSDERVTKKKKTIHYEGLKS